MRATGWCRSAAWRPATRWSSVLRRVGFTYALLGRRGGGDEARFVPPMRGHFYDIVPFYASNAAIEQRYRVTVPVAKNLPVPALQRRRRGRGPHRRCPAHGDGHPARIQARGAGEGHGRLAGRRAQAAPDDGARLEGQGGLVPRRPGGREGVRGDAGAQEGRRRGDRRARPCRRQGRRAHPLGRREHPLQSACTWARARGTRSTQRR